MKKLVTHETSLVLGLICWGMLLANVIFNSLPVKSYLIFFVLTILIVLTIFIAIVGVILAIYKLIRKKQNYLLYIICIIINMSYIIGYIFVVSKIAQQ